MRFVTLLIAAVACSGGSAAPKGPAPEPVPTAAPVAPVAPAADAVSKDTDISGMSADEQKAFLMKLGEKVYNTGDGGLPCVTCHQGTGLGMPGAFPPLVGQKDHMGDCKTHAGLIIKGLSGEITVNDVKYNGVMPPQGDAFNDLQIAAVTTYTRMSWGNDYGACSVDDVKSAR